MNSRKYGLPNNDVVNSALKLAIDTHAGERRKSFPYEPYVNHPIRVAQTISKLSDFKDDMITIASALTHDTKENRGLKKAVFVMTFGEITGSQIFDNVCELSIPDYITNNDAKNQWQLNHMSIMTPKQQQIKLADRIDNVKTLPRNWPAERKVEYIIHSQNLLHASSQRLTSLGIESSREFNEAILKYSPAADQAKAYARKSNSFFFFFRRSVAALSF